MQSPNGIKLGFFSFVITSLMILAVNYEGRLSPPMTTPAAASALE